MAFEKPTHKCPTQFSETNFKYKKYSLTSTKHSISARGPKIWKKLLTKEKYNPTPYSQEKLRLNYLKVITKGNFLSRLPPASLSMDQKQIIGVDLGLLRHLVWSSLWQWLTATTSGLLLQRSLSWLSRQSSLNTQGLMMRFFSFLQVLFSKQIVINVTF